MPSDAWLWQCLLALREACRGGPPGPPLAICAAPDDTIELRSEAASDAVIRVDAEGAWHSTCRLTEAQTQLLDLYLPVALAGPGRPLTLAHLGQSLDGRIATENGRSHYVTGGANLVHLHRLRALCDAVVVGAGTVEADDPRLTTRRVPGPNPVRVVLDPRRRLPAERAVFQDGEAETLVFCEDGAGAGHPGETEVIEMGAGFSPADVVNVLHDRGLQGIFVEGGGVTVSRFLQEGVLDRLQVTVAPLVIGSGKPGLTLPVIDDLSQALRPECRTFKMGQDVLFELALESSPSPSSG